MAWTFRGRPVDPARELIASHAERRADAAALGGLAGLREIRRRLRAVRAAKAAAGGRALADDELDALGVTAAARRGRDWAAREGGRP